MNNEKRNTVPEPEPIPINSSGEVTHHPPLTPEELETQESTYSDERIKRSFVVNGCCNSLDDTLRRYNMSFNLKGLGSGSLEDSLRITRVLSHRKNFSIIFPKDENLWFNVAVTVGFFEVGIGGYIVLDEVGNMKRLHFRTFTIGNVEAKERNLYPNYYCLYGVSIPESIPVAALYAQYERPRCLLQVINGQTPDNQICERVCLNCVRKMIDIMMTSLDLWVFLDTSLTYRLRQARLNAMKKWMERESEICNQIGVTTLRLSTGGKLGDDLFYRNWKNMRGFGDCSIDYDLYGNPIPLSMHNRSLAERSEEMIPDWLKDNEVQDY